MSTATVPPATAAAPRPPVLALEGVVCVLGRPMAGRNITFDRPAADLTPSLDVPLRHGEQRVGRIHRVWQERGVVRFLGVLDTGLPGAGALADEIHGGHLIALMDASSGRMDYEYGGMVVTGWHVTGLSLLGASARPWPEVQLWLIGRN